MVAAAPRAATNASAVMGRTSSRTVSTLAAKTITQAPVWAAGRVCAPAGPRGGHVSAWPEGRSAVSVPSSA